MSITSEFGLFDHRCAMGICKWGKIIDVWGKRCAMRLGQVLVNGVGQRQGSYFTAPHCVGFLFSRSGPVRLRRRRLLLLLLRPLSQSHMPLSQTTLSYTHTDTDTESLYSCGTVVALVAFAWQALVGVTPRRFV